MHHAVLVVAVYYGKQLAKTRPSANSYGRRGLYCRRRYFQHPRNGDIIVIGGVAEPYLLESDSLVNSSITKRLRTCCEAFPTQTLLRPSWPNVPVNSMVAAIPTVRCTRWKGARALGRVHTHRQGGTGWSLELWFCEWCGEFGREGGADESDAHGYGYGGYVWRSPRVRVRLCLDVRLHLRVW